MYHKSLRCADRWEGAGSESTPGLCEKLGSIRKVRHVAQDMFVFKRHDARV